MTISYKFTLLNLSVEVRKVDQMSLISHISTEKLVLLNLHSYINKCVLWEISKKFLKLVQFLEP